MSISTKKLFLSYLRQLRIIVDKTPDSFFLDTLSEGMFSLELNAQVAANFLLRGYCPLVSVNVRSFELAASGKDSVCRLLDQVNVYLESLPEVLEFDDLKVLSDSAGFSEVKLPQSRFIPLWQDSCHC